MDNKKKNLFLTAISLAETLHLLIVTTRNLDSSVGYKT